MRRSTAAAILAGATIAIAGCGDGDTATSTPEPAPGTPPLTPGLNQEEFVAQADEICQRLGDEAAGLPDRQAAIVLAQVVPELRELGPRPEDEAGWDRYLAKLEQALGQDEDGVDAVNRLLDRCR